MYLTKTNFIHYLNCPKSLWIYKCDPAQYPNEKFSVFLQKLTSEGHEVEKYVRELFINQDNNSVEHQKIFKTDSGLVAIADVFETTYDGRKVLYEVKSSTSVKTDRSHNHLKDACFQKIVAELAGHSISQVFIIHLNSSYVRGDNIVHEQLLHFEDVTERVDEIYEQTTVEIDQALTLLKQDEINRIGCSCIFKSRAHHCDTFSYFNPDIEKLSIYCLPRLSDKKRREFIANNIFDLKKITLDHKLSELQTAVLMAAQSGNPHVHRKAIKLFLSDLQFPLYFLDYETFASTVPLVEGSSPHKHFPVQYSLHILEEDGSLSHSEFIERSLLLPHNLLNKLERAIGSVGSVISWHASFEKTQNKEMVKWFPDKKEFIQSINNRIVDLEDVFKTMYIDAKFEGSTSIKKVLPVLCPHLNYDELDVQDGASAMVVWKNMVNENDPDMAKSLLLYCKLDTFAMVEIFRFLKKL